jgi:hypothetical protein
MTRHRHVKKVVKYFSEFAVHIWIILLLANILLVYTFHFYLHAAPNATPKSSVEKTLVEESLDIKSFNTDIDEEMDEPDEIIPTLTPEPTETVLQVPNGPLLGLSFGVPGIGSAGGNFRPIHPTRNVTIYLYPTGVNSLDKKTRPLNTVKAKVRYDANVNSSTYGRFINSRIDLGSHVADGEYQIVIKTDKSFRTLLREKSNSVGGIVYSLEKRAEENNFPLLPFQIMVMGDLFPLSESDNVVDLNDYAVLVNCYRQKTGTPPCPDPHNADINDDGMVDGLDYNVMVLGYRELQNQGIKVPELLILPTGKNVSRLSYLTPKLTKSPARPTPTTIPDETKSEGGGGILGILLFVIFLAILGGGGFFLYLKNAQVKALIDGIIHRSPGAKAAPKSEQGTAQPDQQPQPQPNPPAETQTPTTEQPTEAQPQSTEPAAPASASTDTTPASQLPPTPEATTAAPVAVVEDHSASADQAKEYFVKKQSDDETKTGFWLTLTDDNGPTLAHYKGTEVADGFANIKGEMKTENGKTFLEIAELTPEG